MGGSLNISFNNGCLSIRYHLFIKMVFKFGTEGRYYIIYRNQINSRGGGYWGVLKFFPNITGGT